jgi:hypothetical protein
VVGLRWWLSGCNVMLKTHLSTAQEFETATVMLPWQKVCTRSHRIGFHVPVRLLRDQRRAELEIAAERRISHASFVRPRDACGKRFFEAMESELGRDTSTRCTRQHNEWARGRRYTATSSPGPPKSSQLRTTVGST